MKPTQSKQKSESFMSCPWIRLLAFYMVMSLSVVMGNVYNNKQSISLVPVVRQFFSNTDKQWLSQLPGRPQSTAASTINANWKQAYLKKEVVKDNRVLFQKK